jgi:hypothetical protein
MDVLFGDLIPIVLNWLPVLLLIVVFAVFAVRSQSVYMGKGGKTHGEMLEDHIAELRRQNDLLEQIVRGQEARLQRLETTRRSASTGGVSGAAGR